MSNVELNRYKFKRPGRLFWHRLGSHFKDIWGIVHSIADWTVLLYILIPGAAILGGLYYGLWKEPLPSWSDQLPYGVVPLFILLFMMSGKVLLMLREGDVLFIVPHRRWVNGMMLRGCIYSMAATTLKITVGFILLLPFLVRKFQMDFIILTCLYLFSICSGWVLMWLKHFARIQWTGWHRRLLYIPLVWVPSIGYMILALVYRQQPVVLGLIAAILAVISFLMIKLRLKLRGTFMRDVQEDLVQRTKLTGLVLSHAVDKPRPIQRKPWVYRGSRPVFRSVLPSRRLAGAAIKALIRNPGQLKLYLQFTVLGLGLLAILPTGIQVLVFVALNLLLAYWLCLHWFRFRGDAFISLLPWTDDITNPAFLLTVRALLFPFAAAASAVLLFTHFPVWAVIIAFLPLAAAVCWAATPVLTLMMIKRKT